MHLEIATCYRSIARLQYIAGEYAEAVSNQQKALIMFERVLGKTPFVLLTQGDHHPANPSAGAVNFHKYCVAPFCYSHWTIVLYGIAQRNIENFCASDTCLSVYVRGGQTAAL